MDTENDDELALMLRETKKRNKHAYQVIGAVSGLGEKRVREIAKSGKVTLAERSILRALAA